MGLAELAAEHDAMLREQVYRETWGHLDAEPGRTYPGTLVCAEGAFGGDRIVLVSEFGEAGYGPWFYEGLHDWLHAQDMEPGKLYRWTGFYRLEDDGQHSFIGVSVTVQDV